MGASSPPRNRAEISMLETEDISDPTGENQQWKKKERRNKEGRRIRKGSECAEKGGKRKGDGREEESDDEKGVMMRRGGGEKKKEITTILLTTVDPPRPLRTPCRAEQPVEQGEQTQYRETLIRIEVERRCREKGK